MQILKSRSVATMFVSVVLCLAGVAATAAFVDTRPDTVKANEWAARQAASGRLPVTVDDVGKLPFIYRHAVFMQMTPAQRSSMWQDQFARVASERGLSAEQRAFLLKYRSLLSPAVYDTHNSNRKALQDEISWLCPQIKAMFNADQQWELKNIGPRPGPAHESALVKTARWLQATAGVAVVSARDPDCTCASKLGACDCPDGQVCKGLICVTVFLNCGCGGDAVDCNSLCGVPSN